MQSLTYTNSEGYCVTFGMLPPYVQSHIDGIGELEGETLRARAAGLDGFFDYGCFLGAREISVSATLISGAGRAEMYRLREALARALNPKLSGYLRYRNDRGSWRIGARPQKLPVYGTRRADTVPLIAYFSCPMPYWEDDEENVLPLGNGVGQFRFPLKLPMEFARAWRERSLINDGHVETPVRIELSGPLVNPEVRNLTTGERLRVERSIDAGGMLLVDTDVRCAHVTLRHPDGRAEDATHWLTVDSSLFQLPVGESVIRYTRDNESSANRMDLIYRRRYAGV